MKKNVEGAKFVIAIISDGAGVAGNGYFERPFCLKELRWAKAAGTYIQPVIDEADKTRVAEFIGMAPDDLKKVQDIDFVDVCSAHAVAMPAQSLSSLTLVRAMHADEHDRQGLLGGRSEEDHR